MKAHVHPCERLAGRVDPPSSKNYTTRYLLVSVLAGGHSRVMRPAVSEDALAMVECARMLGACVQAFDRAGKPIEFSVDRAEEIAAVDIDGIGAASLASHNSQPTTHNPQLLSINPHNAGAVLRMLLGIGALWPRVEFVTDHPDSLGKRPNRDLLDALERIGVEWEARTPAGELPIVLRGGRERIAAALDRLAAESATGRPQLTVSGAVSSQFVSAMLFLAPLLGRDVEVVVTEGLKSRPLVDTTLEVMRQAGVTVESSADALRHLVRGGANLNSNSPEAAPGYRAREWIVNGDWPGAAALLAAAAAVPRSDIAVERLFEDLQGERRVLEILRSMGCEARLEEASAAASACAPNSAAASAISNPAAAQSATSTFAQLRAPLGGPDSLRAAAINGDLCTDAVPALYAAAALAAGETRIFGIRNLQYKECDRIRRPIEELRRVYATRPDFQRADGSPDAQKLARALEWCPDEDPGEVVIRGCPDGFEGGIEVDGCGDHRVIMMLSIVAMRCRKGLAILGAEHVAKSYPRWFDDLRALGAQCDFSE